MNQTRTCELGSTEETVEQLSRDSIEMALANFPLSISGIGDRSALQKYFAAGPPPPPPPATCVAALQKDGIVTECGCRCRS